MLLYLIYGAGGLMLGIFGGYLFGAYAGKIAKMEELWDLQDEGWLTITHHDRKPGRQSSGAHREGTDAISKLLYDEPEELGVRTLSRPRRDSEERRGDWAKTIKDSNESEHTNDEHNSDSDKTGK